jgi:drug/metabolite transporter (DMT)-like permease
MSVLLGLLAAATYGSSDFLAGIASRRLAPIVVTAGAQAICLAVGLVAIAPYPGDGLSRQVLLWGAASGVGSAGGTFALYRGLGGGEMSVVATLSGLLTAVIPVVVGLATGDSLSGVAATGIVVAVPAIGLVSWGPRASGGGGGSGAVWGILAGLGFGLLFVGYDRAGSAAGAWPQVVAEGVAVLLTAPPALPALRRARQAAAGGAGGGRRSAELLLAAGLLAGVANLSFVIATHHGELAVVAVLTALYPGFTVILARLVLGDRWSGAQKIGLATALLATFLVSLGST